jgi:hypothetical protein
MAYVMWCYDDVMIEHFAGGIEFGEAQKYEWMMEHQVKKLLDRYSYFSRKGEHSTEVWREHYAKICYCRLEIWIK